VKEVKVKNNKWLQCDGTVLLCDGPQFYLIHITPQVLGQQTHTQRYLGIQYHHIIITPTLNTHQSTSAGTGSPFEATVPRDSLSAPTLSSCNFLCSSVIRGCYSRPIVAEVPRNLVSPRSLVIFPPTLNTVSSEAGTVGPFEATVPWNSV
jgi:hypothetical protein